MRIGALALGTMIGMHGLTGDARAQNAEEMQIFSHTCMMDYFEFCAGLSPNGPEVRACFKTNRARLSSACAGAIASYERRLGRASRLNPASATGQP